MRLLLDTHIFLWTLDDSPRLSRRAREIMTAPGAECFVSAVSFWESFAGCQGSTPSMRTSAEPSRAPM